MSRSANGIYTLPEDPFLPHTRMVSSVMNSQLSDIANTLTLSLPTTGVAPMTGPAKGSTGAVTNPSFSFATDTDTGWYLVGSNVMAFVVGGLPTIRFNSDLSVTRLGNTVFDGDVIFDDFTYTATVTVSNDLNVTGSSSWSGQVVISSIGQFTSTVSFSSSVHFGSSIEIKVSTTAGYMRFTEITAPSSAAANSIRLYVKDVSASSVLEWQDENGVEQQPGKIQLLAFSVTNVAAINIALTAYTGRFNNFSFYIIGTETTSPQDDTPLRFSQDGGATYLSTAGVYQYCIQGADTSGIAPFGSITSQQFAGIGNLGTAGIAEIILYNVNAVDGNRPKVFSKGSGGSDIAVFTPNMWRAGGMITASNISGVRFFSNSTILKFKCLMHGWA